MKKTILIGIILIIAVGAGLLTARLFLSNGEDVWICQNNQWVKHGNPASPAPVDGCGIVKEIKNFEECIIAGYQILESYPSRCVTPEGKAFFENIGNEMEKADLIEISNPRPNQVIKSPLVIEGRARGNWFFEASFPVYLLDGNGKKIGQAVAQAQGDWMTTDFVPFKATLEFAGETMATGTLILQKDNPSGLPENADQLFVPIKFEALATSIVVKSYFNNSKMDPEISCNKVFPVDRIIFKTLSPGRTALEELLKGPTAEEKAKGFFTSINQGVKIEKLSIVDGVASVEFNEQLEYQVGGSCRVSAIRAQIIETLKQFPTVEEVVISIDGRIEDILQP